MSVGQNAIYESGIEHVIQALIPLAIQFHCSPARGTRHGCSDPTSLGPTRSSSWNINRNWIIGIPCVSRCLVNSRPVLLNAEPLHIWPQIPISRIPWDLLIAEIELLQEFFITELVTGVKEYISIEGKRWRGRGTCKEELRKEIRKWEWKWKSGFKKYFFKNKGYWKGRGDRLWK